MLRRSVACRISAIYSTPKIKKSFRYLQDKIMINELKKKFLDDENIAGKVDSFGSNLSS